MRKFENERKHLKNYRRTIGCHSGSKFSSLCFEKNFTIDFLDSDCDDGVGGVESSAEDERNLILSVFLKE